MALKFAEVIPKSTVIEMFDKFHEQMTGEIGYGFDFDEKNSNPWLAQRDLFILAGRNGIVDEKEEEVRDGKEVQDKNI